MIFRHLFLIPIGIALAAEVPAAEPYLAWRAESASVPEPLGGLKGDAQRGRAVAANQAQGNCLACHPLPIPEEPFHGEIGPPLAGVGSRLPVAEIRLWVINARLIKPDTIMPAFYLDPKEVYRSDDDHAGRTLLSAQQVEDVVAYLATLK